MAHDQYLVVAGEVHRRIALSDPGVDDFRNELLWSPERPTIIEATVELLNDRGDVLDHVESYTALRSFAVSGDRFLLNGRPYPLKLVLDQGYWDRDRDDPARRYDVAHRRLAGKGHGLQRRTQAPEDRGTALSVLGGSPGPFGLGRDAERLPLHQALRVAR